MVTTDEGLPGSAAHGDEPEKTVEDRIAELRKRRKATLSPGGRDAARKQHDKGKLTARERLDVLMDEGSFVETDPFAVHRAHDFGMDRKRPPGDGIITGYGTVDGRKVFVASQDFTVFGGSMGEVHAQKVTQGDGPRDVDRGAVRRDQRLGGRAHPGRRGLARRLRLHLRAERARQRRDPADQRDHGPVRGRRGLLPRDHRLHVHGARDLAHVHHRARRHQDRHRRGRHDGRARRRDDPRHEIGRGLLRRGGRRGRAQPGSLPVELPAVEQPRGSARVRAHRRSRTARPTRSPTSCPTGRKSPTTCTR